MSPCFIWRPLKRMVTFTFGSLGHPQRNIYGYDALLVAVFVDEADFCVPNFLVYQELLTGYVGTPP